MPGAPKAALTGDAAQWVTDHDAYTFTTPGNGDAYRDLIVAYPYIAEAMGYASRVADVRTGTNGIWDAIDAAAEAGFVGAVAVPANVGSTITCEYTRAEAIASYGAKVAHCLWLEVNEIFPWRLASFSLERLKHLLDPNELFLTSTVTTAWDIDGVTPASQYAVCDHSPKMIYDALSPTVSTTANALRGIEAVLDFMASNFSHGSNTISRTHDQYVTLGQTGGCGPASALFNAWGAAVNIPAKRYRGKWDTGSHGTAALFTSSSEGTVLLHADDSYGGTLSVEFPDVRRGVFFSVWDPVIGQEADADTIEYESLRQRGFRDASWVIPSAKASFVYDQSERYIRGSGWPYMLSREGYKGWRSSYMTPQEIEGIYDALADTAVGLPEKPTVSNSGTEGALTADSGTVTMNLAWNAANSGVYEDKDLTGNIVIPQEASYNSIVIRNCRIDGNGGIGIDIQSTNAAIEIYGCEITNCTYGVLGAPFVLQRCYIHGNSNTDVAIENTIGSAVESTIVGNLIDSGSNLTQAIQITTGADRWPFVVANTILSTSAAPVISVDGAPATDVCIERNWIDGGNFCIQQNQTGSETLTVAFNKFGRTASTALFSDIAGPAHVWYGNVYEDDNSTANETDDPTP